MAKVHSDHNKIPVSENHQYLNNLNIWMTVYIFLVFSGLLSYLL